MKKNATRQRGEEKNKLKNKSKFNYRTNEKTWHKQLI